MSNWTHVAGIVRIDCFLEDVEFEELFGKEVRWEDSSEIWNDAEERPEKYLPIGSEGSLRKLIWENPNTSCIARYTVSIFGDLRDHENPQEIIDWFENICKKLGWRARNAVITARNERYGELTWAYKR